MHAGQDHDDDRRPQAALGARALTGLCNQPFRPHPERRGVLMSISAETYARLLSLADQAPLDSLPLTERTLSSAKTLGYNRIGQIRNTPTSRLLADLGRERAEELQQALYDFGMRQTGAADVAA
jgi:hypothetical protein